MIKKIKLKNDKDINKFLKRLPLYNSLFYKFIQFEISGINDSQINSIKTILNEKNRKKKLELIIDESCKYIDNFYNNEDICGFKDCKCYAHQNNLRNLKNGCCRKCLYQSVNGCKTKNVACKLFTCSEVKKRYKVLSFEDINILKCLNPTQRYIVKCDYFSKKEDVVMDLYFSSFIIASFRIGIRFFVNLYKVNHIK